MGGSTDESVRASNDAVTPVALGLVRSVDTTKQEYAIM
jgi:hypothetical protein